MGLGGLPMLWVGGGGVVNLIKSSPLPGQVEIHFPPPTFFKESTETIQGDPVIGHRF